MNIPEIHLSDAPAIPGLHFRRFCNAADYDQMAAIHAASREWDRIDPQSAREGVPTADSLAVMFPHADVRNNPDMLLAEIDGRIVGYNHVLWRWTEAAGTRVYLHLGYLEPAWRGNGIGRALLHWSQDRVREIVADEQPAETVMLATNVSSTEREADALMRNEGYTAVRRLSDMVLESITPLPTLPLPEGVALRLVERGHYRAIYQAWKDAFADVWTSTPPSEADYQEFLENNIDVPNFDATLCQVAWAGNEVVGMVWCHVRKGVGMFPEVAVRRTWQRRGIAGALMVRSLNMLHTRGITQARLFTDADDGRGARSLYERLGFREVKQHIFYRKPLNM
jgi:GNAT superfamily N-acetyltransferase